MSSEASDSTRMIEFAAWFEENKKAVLIGVISVIAVIFALSIYRWNRNRTEAEAGAALFKLEKPSTRTEESSGPGAGAYLELAASYRGTGAGAQALLLGAEALFKEGKYEEARARFDGFRQDYPEHPLMATAEFGVAASLDALDKTNEALTAYQGVATRFPNSGVFGQAKLALARLYESRKEPAQALKIYDELTRPGAMTIWASDAIQGRERLLAQHPELAKTNTPTATTPMLSPSGSNLVPAALTNPPTAAPTTP